MPCAQLRLLTTLHVSIRHAHTHTHKQTNIHTHTYTHAYKRTHVHTRTHSTHSQSHLHTQYTIACREGLSTVGAHQAPRARPLACSPAAAIQLLPTSTSTPLPPHTHAPACLNPATTSAATTQTASVATVPLGTTDCIRRAWKARTFLALCSSLIW
jgi:hypothetical protein